MCVFVCVLFSSVLFCGTCESFFHCAVHVQVWAEKEMRNLKRLVAAGIPAPAPVVIKNNVLVMDFLGRGGWPAPRLRDVQLSPKKIKVTGPSLDCCVSCSVVVCFRSLRWFHD